MKLSSKFPRLFFHTKDVAKETVAVFKIFARSIESMQRDVSQAVNYNEVQYKDQNDQPTPEANQLWLWKDADATSGQPTHYLVYNDGGTVVTFASEETVP